MRFERHIDSNMLGKRNTHYIIRCNKSEIEEVIELLEEELKE